MATLKFYDDFTSPLALWIAPQTGGTWHAPDTWQEQGTHYGQSWSVDPLYPATTQADANPFSTANSILSIKLFQTPADVPGSAVGNFPWLGGEIVSNGRFQTTYGYFEARIKMPAGNGYGGAIILLPHDGAGWPPEIDIMEARSAAPDISTFSIWSNDYTPPGGQPTNKGGYVGVTGADMVSDFHYYAVNWQADFVTWYIDGVQVFQQPTPSDCHQDFYIEIGCNVGAPGDWGGAPDSTTPIPGFMQIDYVAVWDVSPYPGGAGGTAAGLNLNSGGGGTGTASPDGTVLFKGDGTSITDANNHVWTINVSGQVTVDAAADLAAPAGVAELAYVSGTIWRFIPQLPYITPDSGSFTDSAGNVYTITSAGGDVATENGQAMSGGSGTGAMGYYLGTVYAQDEGSGNWFTWDGVQFNNATIVPPLPGSAWAHKTLPTDSWVSGANPLTAAAYTSANNATVSLGSASKLVASDGSAYGLVNTSGGEVVANGVADTSLTGVTEIAYVNSNLWRFQSSTGLWWFETTAAGPWQPSGGTATSPLPVQTTKRAPTDQPFSSTSVWNVGIGSGATWGISTDADVQKLVGLTGNVLAATNGQPIFFGAPSDPLVQITCTDTTFPVPVQTIHVPLGSVPSGPTDGWMNFFDFSQPTKMWSYAGCRLTNGVDVTGGITAAKGSVWDCSGDGVANAINPGSDYNFLVGTITDYDLQSGAIQHALRFSLGVDALKSPGSTWTANIPWPGTHEDLNGPTTYKGNITYGCTVGIPASTVLPSLSRGGTWLATALQKYGAICRIGSAAAGSINFYTTPANEQNQNIVQMRGDMAKIVPLLKIMRNQAPATINGGGSYPPQLPPVDTNPVYYQPQYRPLGTQTWINFGRPVQDTNVVITGLSPATQYEFEVVAFNARGSLISVLVGDATTGGGTLSITGITLTNSTIPAGSPAGTVVGVVSVSMSSGSFSGTVTIGGTNASSFSLTGNSLVTKSVLPQGNYSITLTASQSGVTSFSQPETIVAQSSLPGPPTNITSPSQTSTQVVLSWSPPTIGAKLDTGVYQVQYKTTVSGVWLNGPAVPYCTPGSGSFTDQFGNTWSLNTSNHPVVNGNVDTVSNATMLLTVGGLVWQVDVNSNWYSLQPTGTITSAASLGWQGPTTTSPLTDVVVTGLSASTAYNFQVYVSNTAGNGPAASSTPTSISTAAAASVGPISSSAFLTADFASTYFYPTPGTTTQNSSRGQMIISPRLYGTIDGAFANDGSLVGSFSITDSGPFALLTSTEYQTKMATVCPGLWAELTPPPELWGTFPNVNPSGYANLINNFYKVDPLGISAIILNLNWRDLNISDQALYGQMIHNMATFFQNQTMPNGKRLPVIGFCGQNEPANTDDSAGYYNQIVANCKNVTLPGGGTYIVVGPVSDFAGNVNGGWSGFTGAVPGIDVFQWDNFFEGGHFDPQTNPGGWPPGGRPMSDLQTTFADYFAGGIRSAATQVAYQPSAYWPAGNMDSNADDSDPAMADYRGAVWDAIQKISSANSSPVTCYWAKWDSALQNNLGFITNPSNQIAPSGYANGKQIRTMTGPRWNVTTNAANLLTMACTPAAGRFGLMIVNAGQGAQNNKTVALSRWPVNGSGNASVNVWQMTTSAQPGVDAPVTTISVVNGVTTNSASWPSGLNFPDPSITIIYI